MRVLVVDDDQAMRAALRRFLTRAGFDVIGEGFDGEHGLELARELRPDVVVMDLKLPKLSGTEAARLLRMSNPEISVVMHSAYSEPSFQLVAAGAGATHYVVKGGGGVELIDVLEQIAVAAPAREPDPR